MKIPMFGLSTSSLLREITVSSTGEASHVVTGARAASLLLPPRGHPPPEESRLRLEADTLKLQPELSAYYMLGSHEILVKCLNE